MHQSTDFKLASQNESLEERTDLSQRNHEILARYAPNLAESVKNGFDDRISVFKSKRGEPIASVGDISLHSRYDAASEARTLINQYDLRDKEAIIILGLGLAHHVREVLKRCPKTRIVVIEKNIGLLKAALDHVDLGEIFARAKLFINVPPGALLNDRQMKEAVASTHVVVKHPPSVRLDAAYYDEVVARLEKRNRKGTISAVVQTFNEEQNIEACLQSLAWADEIIVCDSNSKDRTVEICKKFTDKIFIQECRGFVEQNRNFAISKAESEWVFVVDADERIPAELAQKIREAIGKDPDADVLLLPRKNYIFGKLIEHAGWGDDYPIRLFRRGKVHWSPQIHTIPQVNGNIAKMDVGESLAIVHYNYKDISQFLEKMNRYTDGEAERYLAQNQGFVFDPSSLFKGMMEQFFYRYITKEGFKDGDYGLILSLLMSFYCLLTYAKLWERTKEQPTSQ